MKEKKRNTIQYWLDCSKSILSLTILQDNHENISKRVQFHMKILFLHTSMKQLENEPSGNNILGEKPESQNIQFPFY